MKLSIASALTSVVQHVAAPLAGRVRHDPASTPTGGEFAAARRNRKPVNVRPLWEEAAEVRIRRFRRHCEASP